VTERPFIPDGLDASLVLLRHGETEWIVEGRFQGRAETPLTALGRRQAELAGARLARPERPPALPLPATRPAVIVHSPLTRAMATARAVADAMTATADGSAPQPTLRAEPAFAEIGQGAWEGLRHDEIVERYGETLAGWRRRPTETWAPGGESPADVQARLRPALGGLLAELATGRQPGTHDRSQVPGYRGSDLAADRPWAVIVGHDGVFKVLLLTLFDFPLERFWSFTMALGGLSVIELRAGRPVLVAHNLTEHLAPLRDEEARAEAEAIERSRTGAL
jgi:broad specificity phosphatase PhoE